MAQITLRDHLSTHNSSIIIAQRTVRGMKTRFCVRVLLVLNGNLDKRIGVGAVIVQMKVDRVPTAWDAAWIHCGHTSLKTI